MKRLPIVARITNPGLMSLLGMRCSITVTLWAHIVTRKPKADESRPGIMNLEHAWLCNVKEETGISI